MRRSLLIAAILLVPSALPAQTRADSLPRYVRQGKWVGAAMFAGTLTMSVIQHEAADRAFRDLRGYCGTAACAIGPDGRYADAGAESRYQEVVSHDRSARVWLIASQATFIGTAALFIIELARERGTTNIPYSGLLVEPGRVGVRLSF